MHVSAQQKKRIEDNKEAAVLRKKRRLLSEDGSTVQPSESSSSSTAAASTALTAQQRERIEHNKKEAEARKKKRDSEKETVEEEAKPSERASLKDPFGEFADQDFLEADDSESHFEQSPASREETGKSSDHNTCPAPRPPAKPAKYAAASEKLKLVRTKADQSWQKHLSSSVRVAQLLGTAPKVMEENVEEVGTPRFKVHPTHSTMAVRSIVHCKVCGYWASKKSQKLQEQCPKKPPHSDGAHKLKRMLQGLHPDARISTWPDGHDARVPSQPVSVDWS